MENIIYQNKDIIILDLNSYNMRKAIMKKKYISRDGQKILVFDISKDFDKFVKQNEKFLRALSKY